LTFDHVVIDAADAFAAGQVYVALSRCRTLEGITLLTPIPSHALTNAREVLHFTQQQVPLDIAQQQLPVAKGEYLTIQICSLFDFRESIQQSYALTRMISKMTSVQNNSTDYLPSIIDQMEQLQRVGERFQQQVHMLIYRSDFAKLYERLTAAHGYFAPQLHQLILHICNCPVRSNDKADATLIQQSLTDIYALLSRHEYMQSKMTSTTSNTSNEESEHLTSCIFHAKQTFRLKEYDFTIYTTQRKARTSAAGFQYMLLLQQGYRISEIAKLRNVTQKTVIKHLRSFVQDRVLELSDFHPADRPWIKL
jgi:DNA-binding NarL/FixJ family response regulator